MTGATPNFEGKTSTFYLGLAWQFSLSSKFLDKLTNDFTKRLWISPAVSPAAHTGDLHKNDAKCDHNDADCGFDYRVIPQVQLELLRFLKYSDQISVKTIPLVSRKP